MSIRIVTDSTCDLPAETIARYGISVVPLYINVGSRGYLDGVDMTREEFYTRLPSFAVHPTTAVPSQQKFHATYAALADEGASEVLSIHISESLSAVVNVARLTAREFSALNVTVLDARQLSLGTGFLVETAARMADAGRSMSEILAALQSQVQRSHVFAVLNTLEFLKRSGRMNTFMAGIGALLPVKTIPTMHYRKPGNERVRTLERARQRLYELLSQAGPLERIAILHSHAPERVAELRDYLSRYFPGFEPLVAEITPVLGAHIGPGAFGFAVVSAQE